MITLNLVMLGCLYISTSFTRFRIQQIPSLPPLICHIMASSSSSSFLNDRQGHRGITNPIERFTLGLQLQELLEQHERTNHTHWGNKYKILPEQEGTYCTSPHAEHTKTDRLIMDLVVGYIRHNYPQGMVRVLKTDLVFYCISEDEDISLLSLPSNRVSSMGPWSRRLSSIGT